VIGFRAALPVIGLLVLGPIFLAWVIPTATVQPTAPQIGPQPILLRDPTCTGVRRAAGACRPDWVPAQEYDWLAGGHDI
jgi:hypothetical protein